MRAYPMDTHIIMCPHCDEVVETTVWRDGSKTWFQCARCGTYDTVTEDDFLEEEDE